MDQSINQWLCEFMSFTRWLAADSWRMSISTPPFPILKLLNIAWGFRLALGVEGKMWTSTTGFFGGRPRFRLNGGYEGCSWCLDTICCGCCEVVAEFVISWEENAEKKFNRKKIYNSSCKKKHTPWMREKNCACWCLSRTMIWWPKLWRMFMVRGTAGASG